MSDFLDIKFDPTAAAVRSDLQRSIEDVTARLVKSIAEDAPDEMRDLMQTGGVSSKGEPPRVQKGNLSRSLKGNVVSPNEVEIEMIGYAEYLDPIFDGKLDRPFVELGINRAIAKSVNEL